MDWTTPGYADGSGNFSSKDYLLLVISDKHGNSMVLRLLTVRLSICHVVV